MTGDLDEDCVSNKELRDFMKVMTELLTKTKHPPLQHVREENLEMLLVL
jgi:hypothetical protein